MSISLLNIYTDRSCIFLKFFVEEEDILESFKYLLMRMRIVFADAQNNVDILDRANFGLALRRYKVYEIEPTRNSI